MTVMIEGYLSDPAFRSLQLFLLDKSAGDGTDWRIAWNDETVNLGGCGQIRFGLILRGAQRKGISLASLRPGTHALDAAQRDPRKHAVLVATADEQRRDVLASRGLLDKRGYAIVKGNPLPTLIDFPDAALVWGDGWTGEAATSRWRIFMSELAGKFIFPEEEPASPATEENPWLNSTTPLPEGLIGLEGCG